MAPNRSVGEVTGLLWTALGIALSGLVLSGPPVSAQVTRFDAEVVESPAFGGRSFGSVGQYERIRAISHGEVDPDDPRYAGIVNLDLVRKNVRGRVEYRTVVEIYRPIDMTQWNGAIYHTVPNRGRRSLGDDVLRERGFALVQVGWQGDLKPTTENIVPFLPVARHSDGSAVTGRAAEEFIFNDAEAASVATLSYAAASLEADDATLTVRRTQRGTRATPRDMAWTYQDETHIRIERPAGYDGGAIYEFVYTAKDPIVMGLGFVAVRDAISYLRYRYQDIGGEPNPLAFDRLPSTALSIGVSQSGRFLRDFLYQGHNEDASGRIVFDGMHPDIAGSRKTFTNYAFGQPGRWQKQHEDHLYPGDHFPFTYGAVTDPVTGAMDGLLKRCTASDTCPKIIHTDGEAELWQARASLIVTDPAGAHVELPDNVRAYLISGTQHGGGRGVHAAPPTRGACQNPRNPLPINAIRTALTIAMYEWVANGTEPPPSRFPTVENGGLVPAGHLDFPAIPGVTYTGSYNPLYRHDHSTLPVIEVGDPVPVLVGRTDPDGNMIDGVLHPHLSAAIGTHTGWNLRREGFGAPQQCAGSGSFIPFARTRAERERNGDPRLSLEERYPTPESYVEAVSVAAHALVQQRLLLPGDAEAIIDQARGFIVRRW